MSRLFTGLQETVLAVRDLDSAIELLSKAFQSEPDSVYVQAESGIEIRHSGIWIGNHRIAVMQDLSGSGPVSRFIERRGQGLYEVCVRTTDLRAAMKHMRAHGVRFTEDRTRVALDYPWRDATCPRLEFAWTHPSTTHGLIVELQEWQQP